MKKLIYFLTKWDGLWSVPLGFFAFYLAGSFLTWMFGYSTGTYDVAFIQPLLLAATIVIGATNAGIAGMFFTLRGFHNYLYGKKDYQGQIHNFSKGDWKKLSPSQRFAIALLVMAYFITSIIIVYLHLV